MLVPGILISLSIVIASLVGITHTNVLDIVTASAVIISPTPTATPTFMPTPTGTSTPSPSLTPSVTLKPTATATVLPSPTRLLTPISLPSPTFTQTPTVTPTSLVTATPTPIPPTVIPVVSYTSDDLDRWFTQYSNEYGVERELLRKIAACESGFNAKSYNPAGYAGMFQFSAGTWASTRAAMGMDNNADLRFNAEESIRTAAFKISRSGAGAWPTCSR